MGTKIGIVEASKFNALNYDTAVRPSFTEITHRATSYKCLFAFSQYIDNFPFDYIFNNQEELDAFIVNVPNSITRRQCKKKLNEMGLLETVSSSIYAYASSIDDKQLANDIIIDWEDAGTFERYNDTTLMFIQLLGWTSDQADDFFVGASLK